MKRLLNVGLLVALGSSESARMLGQQGNDMPSLLPGASPVPANHGCHSNGLSAIDQRVETILSNMELDDLIGQMTQLDINTIVNRTASGFELNETTVANFARLKVGSYLNSPYAGGPVDGTSKRGWTVQEWRELLSRIQTISMKYNGGHPILYGLDSVRGANYVWNATIFGEQINAAASFNPALVHEMGRIAGRDTLAAGIPWLFAPILDISQNPLWPRTYETFGEDPFLASTMGAAIIKGMQSIEGVAACMKHFIGYSKTPTGHDRDGVTMSDFELLNYFAPSFLAGIKAGAKTIMENYISINGVPVVSSSKILKDLVRHDMEFEGMIVTDWAEIINLHKWHRVAKTVDAAVSMALTNTALDMSMVPDDTSFIGAAKKAVEKNPGLLDRVKESARRIVKLKVELGLYDNPVPGSQLINEVGQDKDLEVALEIARESIVLLKNNDNVLPLATSGSKSSSKKKTPSIFLTGHSADDVGNLCGGWSLQWQGTSGNVFAHGVSVRQGLEKLLGKDNPSLSYFNGLHADGTYSDADMKKAKKMAESADYTIAVIGEATYAEKPGDIDDLALPEGQIKYVRELASTGTKVILVLVEGRPRLLNGLVKDVVAVVHALLPGESGGLALAEILLGKVNPSGRLPITYPKDQANVAITYNHRVSTQCKDGPCHPEFAFGAGLSYTKFEYSNVTLSTSKITSEEQSLTASVTVTNAGSMAGKEVVMLFLIQPYRSLSVPEVKQLKKFEKISLSPGESKVVEFSLSKEDWGVFDPHIGEGFKRVAEDGEYVVAIKPETDCQVYEEDPAKKKPTPLCARFELKTQTPAADLFSNDRWD